MLKPFDDDETATSIGGLSIENGRDRIVASGTLEITLDQKGLDCARALRQLANDLVTALEERHASSAGARAEAATVDRTENPFT